MDIYQKLRSKKRNKSDSLYRKFDCNEQFYFWDSST